MCVCVCIVVINNTNFKCAILCLHKVQAAAAQFGQPCLRAAEPDEAEGFRSRTRSDGAGGNGREPWPMPDRVRETAEEIRGRCPFITLCCLTIRSLFCLFFSFSTLNKKSVLSVFFFVCFFKTCTMQAEVKKNKKTHSYCAIEYRANKSSDPPSPNYKSLNANAAFDSRQNLKLHHFDLSNYKAMSKKKKTWMTPCLSFVSSNAIDLLRHCSVDSASCAKTSASIF